MSLSLFDIVGPIMMGPSSSHTAGAARIGYMSRFILGKEPERITLYFHPVLMQTYAGHRTHVALVAGLLGYREDDPKSVEALEEARRKGITVAIRQIDPPDVHQNTMRVKVQAGSESVMVNGISVGGGSILISAIDGVPVELDGNTYALIVRSPEIPQLAVRDKLQPYGIVAGYSGKVGQNQFVCWSLRSEVFAALISEIRSTLPDASIQLVPPLYSFRQVTEAAPLFSTLAELQQLATKEDLSEVALSYESQRTGKPKKDVWAGMERIVTAMQTALEEGLSGKARLLGGFCSGNDGWRLMQAAKAGKSLAGGIFAAALARAVAVAELNAAMGRVVAAPTAGSAGVVPAVIFSVAENIGKNKTDLVRALLVADAIGVCIANKASLSGAVGGCQGEIGVAAAIAASAAAYLGGGDAEACIHAAALTLKNVLGLICDPAAGPVEVPCIKRNAMGVATALMGAELALAGIRSYIPPDEVVDALVNVQTLLPQELKGSTIGGLGCTRTAASMKTEWQRKLRALEER